LQNNALITLSLTNVTKSLFYLNS